MSTPDQDSGEPRRAARAEGPATPLRGERGDSVLRVSDDTLAAYLGRYLVSDKYWDTVMHGLFSIVAIIMAFVIGNAWGAREAALKEIRGQQAVLTVLSEEIGVLEFHVGALSRRPGNPCQTGFEGDVWKTPVWDAISKSEKFLLIDETFYPRVQKIYGRVATTRKATMGSGRESCLTYLDGLASELKEFHRGKDGIGSHIAKLKGQYERNRRLFSTSLWQIITLAALGLLLAWSMPPALHAAEFILRKRITANRRKTTVRPGERAPSVRHRAADRPAGVAPPGLETGATDGPATTRDS